MVDINIRTVGDNEDTVLDKRPRKVVGSDAFEQPERTRKGLIDKLKVMVDFQLY
jgi:ATP-dependent DNA helicase RecG